MACSTDMHIENNNTSYVLAACLFGDFKGFITAEGGMQPRLACKTFPCGEG